MWLSWDEYYSCGELVSIIKADNFQVKCLIIAGIESTKEKTPGEVVDEYEDKNFPIKIVTGASKYC